MVLIFIVKVTEENTQLFANSANKQMQQLANIPRYVNLNDKLDRDSFVEFVNGTCHVWNQYIPYCSFCTSP